MTLFGSLQDQTQNSKGADFIWDPVIEVLVIEVLAARQSILFFGKVASQLSIGSIGILR